MAAQTRAQSLFVAETFADPMTLKLEDDINILKMYFHTENEVAGLRHSKLRA